MPRWRPAACAALVVVLSVTSCATKSPPQQKARERKAAGVVLFRIHCSKDLWTSIEKLSASGYDPNDIPAKVTPGTNGLSTVELSGPNLVALLEKLDYFAHGGEGIHDPLAIRMYNAVAPRVDAIGSNPGAGDPVPEVTVDDRVGGVSSAPTPTVSPTKKR